MNPSTNDGSQTNPPPPIAAQPAPPMAVPAAPAPQPAAVPAVPVDSQAAPKVPATAGLAASDDTDLIEKEWVNKAKQIVEHTRNDPHKQSEELTLMKVDYMKKRYNKTIKLDK